MNVRCRRAKDCSTRVPPSAAVPSIRIPRRREPRCHARFSGHNGATRGISRFAGDGGNALDPGTFSSCSLDQRSCETDFHRETPRKRHAPLSATRTRIVRRHTNGVLSHAPTDRDHASPLARCGVRSDGRFIHHDRSEAIDVRGGDADHRSSGSTARDGSKPCVHARSDPADRRPSRSDAPSNAAGGAGSTRQDVGRQRRRSTDSASGPDHAAGRPRWRPTRSSRSPVASRFRGTLEIDERTIPTWHRTKRRGGADPRQRADSLRLPARRGLRERARRPT